MEAFLGTAPGIYDPRLIVEEQADLGTSGDTEIQVRRGGAIFVNTDRYAPRVRLTTVRQQRALF